MKAQQASLETLVPSGQRADSAAGAALTTAARAAKAKRDAKAIGMSVASFKKEERERTRCPEESGEQRRLGVLKT